MELSEKRNHLPLEDMIEELEQYYEAAGFADFYLRELKGKTSEEIRELYRITFDENPSTIKIKKSKLLHALNELIT